MVSCARPPLLPPLLLVECALEPPTTRAKIHSRANPAHSVTAIESPTAVRHRRQRCRGGTYFDFRRCWCSVASLSSNAAKIASVKSPRAPTPSADDCHGVVPAAETSASSVVSSNQVMLLFFFFCFDGEKYTQFSSVHHLFFCISFSTARTRAFSDVPLGHGLSSATGPALPAPFPSTAA